jgi:phage terminase large subunit-like protein
LIPVPTRKISCRLTVTHAGFSGDIVAGQDPCAWIERNLYDPETGAPFKLLPAERAFLAHALTLDSDGRLVHSELIYSAIKKSGKTTFAALIVLTVILLYGSRYAEAYICANDLEQATSRTYEAIKRATRPASTRARP